MKTSLHVWPFAVVLLASSCVSEESGSIPDASGSAIDAKVENVIDAGMNQPDANQIDETCMALWPEPFMGTTPFGNLYLTVDRVAMSDCITTTQAHIGFKGEGDERMDVYFSYPVSAGANGMRYVSSNAFDVRARVEYTRQGATSMDETWVHMDVASWKEVESGPHEIEALFTIDDPERDYPYRPTLLRGTFCHWAYLTCGP
jgi:hypothetical protein